jgi:Glycosyl transferase family 90
MNSTTTGRSSRKRRLVHGHPFGFQNQDDSVDNDTPILGENEEKRSSLLKNMSNRRWLSLLSLLQRCHVENQSRKDPIKRRLLVRRRRMLFTLVLMAALVGIIKLYRIYREETNPSPFLPSPYNYLPYRIRGVAPPSHLFTFPTPQQRIEFYMGDWYHNDSTANPHSQHLNSTILCNAVDVWRPGMPEIGRPYRFNANNLQTLVYQGAWKRLPWRPRRSHSGDAHLYHFELLSGNRPNNKQMLLQFGDGKDSAKFLSTPYPLMVKTRLSRWVYEERYDDNAALQRSKQTLPHFPPILGMYEIHRHYHDHFYETDDLWEQLPWHSKRDTVIWRGSTSGQRRAVIQQYIDAPKDDMDIAFSEILKVHQGKFRMPDAYYLRNAMSVRELLSYKYLLVLEGWGMASSLKWMLYSNSVVFMARPTKTSWAMEETLVPYVHYIPLWQNYSNLPQQLEWARSHDEECRKIALYSRHYMERLVTSPQAQQETLQVLRGIDDVYQQQYGRMLQEC